MNQVHRLCAIAGTTLLAVAACTNEPERVTEDEIRAHIERTESYLPSAAFAELSKNIIDSGLTDAPDRMKAAEDAGLAGDGLMQFIQAEYADIAQTLDSRYFDTLSADIVKGDLEGFEAMMDRPEIAAITGCASERTKPSDYATVIQACLDEHGGNLTDEERAVVARYVPSANKAFMDETMSLYFLGTHCRLIEKFDRAISTERTTFSTTSAELSFGDLRDLDCEEARDRLLDIRTSATPGKVIER